MERKGGEREREKGKGKDREEEGGMKEEGREVEKE